MMSDWLSQSTINKGERKKNRKRERKKESLFSGFSAHGAQPLGYGKSLMDTKYTMYLLLTF